MLADAIAEWARKTPSKPHEAASGASTRHDLDKLSIPTPIMNSKGENIQAEIDRSTLPKSPTPIANDDVESNSDLESLPSRFQNDNSPTSAELESLVSWATFSKRNLRGKIRQRSDDMESLPSLMESEIPYPRHYDELESLDSRIQSAASLGSWKKSNYRALNETLLESDPPGSSDLLDDASYIHSSETSGEEQTFYQSNLGEGSASAPTNYSVDITRIFFRTWADDYLNFGPRVTSLFESAHWKTLHTEQLGFWDEPTMSSLEDVLIGLLKFKWVTLSAMVLCRNIQACKTCAGHPLEHPDTFPTTSPDIENSPRSELLGESTSGSDQLSISLSDTEGYPSVPKDDPVKPTNNVQPFNYEDDDYFTAPMELKKTNIIPDRLWTFGGETGKLLLPSDISNWTDRGFRISKYFFRTVKTRLPDEQDHPVNPPSISRSASDLCIPHLKEGLLPISAAEMLVQAGKTPGSDASHRIFIRGKGPKAVNHSSKSQFLALDLERDRVEIDTESVNISVDVDSLIWVVSASQFSVKSFQLFLMPNPRPGMVGINKSNSVYVNLLSPPTTRTELHDPSLRKRVEMPLSRIPHLEFGYCGQGSRRVNFFFFFPRMIFKGSKGRYLTSIPGPLAELWHERVILPSCHAVYSTKPGYSEYQPHTLQEIWDRTGKAKRKEINVIGMQQSMLMAEILRRVGAEDYLSCFGSPFIVADGRGMKFTTKQCISPAGSAPSFDLIKAQFPDLDWDQMLAVEKGELYLDLGTSYHPQHPVPLDPRRPYLLTLAHKDFTAECLRK
ncbi:hypothetical protein HYPSUDRAFT_54899 [Hypholoma sublateritium FD-334 SS-4]|uniref:Uncharacterized protein n=1 Tax=Hypholoma sublateritium (strain FD-334 SS-4) TaxID=945553 RepID=A0A0D2PR47_HYPSF|nr:hypothetical protein HYPSUDRAFT_54899 [Hypholoma sublateritium FD-334 SS-4]